MVELIMVTYNRLDYTKKAVRALLKQTQPFRLTIWDNGSRKDTVKYLKRLNDKRIKIILNDKNYGLSHAVDCVFSDSSADYIGKVDNDTLVPPKWLEKCVESHKKTDLGFIGGFHFRKEDMKGITPKITEINGVKVWEKSHIGGCSFVIKRSDYQAYGKIGGEGIWGLTDYQWKMYKNGKTNGYLYPLIWVEHMEDSRSRHCINNKEHNLYKSRVRNLSINDATSVFIEQSNIYLRQNATIN